MASKSFIFIFLIFLSILLFRFFSYASDLPQFKDGQEVRLETVLLQEPSNTGTTQRLNIRPNGLDYVFVTIPRFPEYHYGDRLVVRGEIKEIMGDDIGNKTVPLLGIKQTMFAMYFPKIEIQKSDPSMQGLLVDYVITIARGFREQIGALYRESLPPISASLLMGIVLGVKDDLPKDFADSLRSSGVMHVVVASGMNVSMVAAFLFGTLSLVTRRQYAIVLSIIGIFFYALVSGFNAPILRACLMSAVAFSAQIVGRQNTGGYALLLAGFFLLFISPMLLFDIGFQLSFMATMGLLFLRPIFEEAKNSTFFFKKIIVGQDFLTTLAAQLATLPILLGSFGTYSLFSILVNTLVLWTIPVLMILGALAGAIGFFFPFLGQIVLYLALPFLLYFERMVSWFGTQDAMMQIESLPMSVVVGYYLVLGSIVIARRKKEQAKPQK